MRIGDTVIELDRERADVPAEGPGPPAMWWRWLGVAVAAALSAAVLVAAAPASGGRLVEVARVSSTAVVTTRMAGSTLFAVMLDRGPHLVAFRLADGAKVWDVPLTAVGADAEVGRLDVVDGVVLVSMSGGRSAVQTVAVDAATGRELWRSDLPQIPRLGDSHTVVLGGYRNPDGSLVPAWAPRTDALPAQPLLLRRVEVQAGRLVWAYQVPAGWRTALPGAVDGAQPGSGFVVISPIGRATTVDLATGSPQASATIDAAATTQDGVPGGQVGVSGNQLVVATTRQGRSTVAAYRVNTLSLQWTAALPAVVAFFNWCGRWLCVSDQQGLHAITPDTGSPAWTTSNVAVTRLGRWVNGWFYDAPDPTPGDATLTDPVTQRVVLNLGSWRVVPQSTTGPVLLTSVQPGSNGTWLGLLTPTPRVDVLGVVTIAGMAKIDCEVGDAYLACLTLPADQLLIWRFWR